MEEKCKVFETFSANLEAFVLKWEGMGGGGKEEKGKNSRSLGCLGILLKRCSLHDTDG